MNRTSKKSPLERLIKLLLRPIAIRTIIALAATLLSGYLLKHLPKESPSPVFDGRWDLLGIIAILLVLTLTVYLLRGFFQKEYTVPFEGGWDLRKSTVCAADNFADLKFPLKDGCPCLESRKEITRLDCDPATHSNIQKLERGALFQLQVPPLQLAIIKITAINPVTRTVSFHCRRRAL